MIQNPTDHCEDEAKRLLKYAGADPSEPKAAEDLRNGDT